MRRGDHIGIGTQRKLGHLLLGRYLRFIYIPEQIHILNEIIEDKDEIELHDSRGTFLDLEMDAGVNDDGENIEEEDVEEEEEDNYDDESDEHDHIDEYVEDDNE
ncbi:hypothetical protein PTKIN_Ptkin04bG0085900 [Pterospermum kingtungense]